MSNCANPEMHETQTEVKERMWRDGTLPARPVAQPPVEGCGATDCPWPVVATLHVPGAGPTMDSRVCLKHLTQVMSAAWPEQDGVEMVVLPADVVAEVRAFVEGCVEGVGWRMDDARRVLALLPKEDPDG